MTDKEEGWKKAGAPGPKDQNIIKELNEIPDASFAKEGDLLVAVVECRECKLEADLGTEEVPHPIDQRVHTCFTSRPSQPPQPKQCKEHSEYYYADCPKCFPTEMDNEDQEDQV